VSGLRFENVVQVRSATSSGAGYRIAPGLVLTAAHVVGASDEVTVDGVTARVVWSRQDDAVDASLVALPQTEPGLGTRFGAFVTTRAPPSSARACS
jgi:S1-C subfamily serine protease